MRALSGEGDRKLSIYVCIYIYISVPYVHNSECTLNNLQTRLKIVNNCLVNSPWIR